MDSLVKQINEAIGKYYPNGISEYRYSLSFTPYMFADSINPRPVFVLPGEEDIYITEVYENASGRLRVLKDLFSPHKIYSVQSKRNIPSSVTIHDHKADKEIKDIIDKFIGIKLIST
jgi:hypothetical protein